MRIKRILCALLALCLAAIAVPAFDLTAQAASPYYITVDLTNQIVTVYDSDNVSEEGIVRQMICSSGKSSTPTPTGTFTMPKKSRSSERTEWYYFASSHCYAKWASRIRGGILFHSILFNSKKGNPTKTSVNALGSKASHGCVRLKIEDAKWIAKNVPAGTKVKIFNGKKNATLHKLILKKTFSRSEQTYDSYLGRPPKDPNLLARYSRGDNVKKLQKRLQELGFYDGSVDGVFGAATETALKYYQAARGISKTGTVNITTSAWDDIFADDAPIGTYATLKTGMSGPAVKALQQALVTCKMYDGPVNGTYDATTAAAVKRYQAGFGYTANGAASSAMQANAISRAASLKAKFGDEEYQLVEDTHPILMAKVKPKKLKMRKKASTRASTVKTLKKNQRVRVLKKAKWSRVKYGSKTGYVMKKYLKFYYGSETVLSYVAVPPPEPEQEPETTTQVPEANSDAVVAAPAAEPAEPAAENTPATTYAVALHDDVKLYAEASAEGEPVAAMSANSAVEVISVEGDWVKVACQDQTLYVAAADVELADLQPAGQEVQPGTEGGEEPQAEPAAEGQGEEGQAQGEEGQAEGEGTGLVIEGVSSSDQENGEGVPTEGNSEPNE